MLELGYISDFPRTQFRTEHLHHLPFAGYLQGNEAGQQQIQMVNWC